MAVKAVKPWVAWEQCANAEKAPSGMFGKLGDSWFKDFASCWFWKALRAHQALHKDPLFLAGNHSQRQMKLMEEAFQAVNDCAREYADALERKDKKYARKCAKALCEIAQEYLQTMQDSRTLAAKIAASRAELNKMVQPDGFKMILARRDVDAKILIANRFETTCNVGYREDAIRSLIAWLDATFQESLNAGQDKRIFWIYGERGCGKSVIAHYLAKKCDNGGILAAGYLFHDNFGPNSMPKLTANLAEDLMEFLGVGFQLQLQRYCKDNHVNDADFFKKPFKKQFEQFLLPAWQGLTALEKRPMLIVLDEIDRCQPWAITEICEFIEATISPAYALPIYYIVASCQDPTLRNWFEESLGLAGRVLAFNLPLYDPEGVKAPKQPPEGMEAMARAFSRSSVSLSRVVPSADGEEFFDAPEPSPTESEEGLPTPRPKEFQRQQQEALDMEGKIAVDPYTLEGALLAPDDGVDWEMDLGAPSSRRLNALA